MINMFEVNETNNMITQEKLDVRTITMGISLLDCIETVLLKRSVRMYITKLQHWQKILCLPEKISRKNMESRL